MVACSFDCAMFNRYKVTVALSSRSTFDSLRRSRPHYFDGHSHQPIVLGRLHFDLDYHLRSHWHSQWHTCRHCHTRREDFHLPLAQLEMEPSSQDWGLKANELLGLKARPFASNKFNLSDLRPLRSILPHTQPCGLGYAKCWTFGSKYKR